MSPKTIEKMSNERKVGQRVADIVASTVGSWRFIIIQSCILAFWIFANATGKFGIKWDEPPFILLNLLLSFQAAYTGPVVMMSQNRQSEVDRRHAEEDFRINKLAEGEIELIQNQLNTLQIELKKNTKLTRELAIIRKELKEFSTNLSTPKK
jgi:uncharacterized membrane protein